MKHLFAFYWTALGTAGAVLLFWGGFGLNQHAIAAFDHLNDVTVRLNSKTGPITETDKLLLALKSTTVHVDETVAHEEKNLARYDALADQLAGDVHGVAVHLTATADAATRAAQSAAGTLDAAKGSLEGLAPVETNLAATAAALTRTTDDADSLVADPHVKEFMAHLDGTMGHVEGISASSDKIAAHLEKTVDAPKPLWQTILPGSELALKLWACAFKQVCVN